MRDTLDLLRGKRVGLNVISKSGTTTETGPGPQGVALPAGRLPGRRG